MNCKLLFSVALPACSVLQVAMLLSGVRAFGQTRFGNIRGITGDQSGAALPEVQVSAHSLEGNTDCTVVSGADGTFAFENLKPGRYQLTARKEGLRSLPAATVELAAGQSLRSDITLAPPNGPRASRAPASFAVSDNSDRASLTELEKQLLERIDRLEQRLAALEAIQAARPNTTLTPNQAAPATALDSGSSQVADATQAAQASPDKAATPTAAQAQPVLVAALAPAEALPPVENTKVLSIAPTPVTPVTAEPPAVPLAGTTSASPSQEASPEKNKKPDPFSDADWTWLNGNPRTKNIYWDTKFFTPEIRSDVTYTYDFNHPKDHSMGGSTELFRSQEVQVEQLGVGGDFHYDNVRARLMTQFGMYSETTPRNDPSPANGQWDLDTAYRYVSEAYGGYHFNKWYGINVDAGIFMSYIGLFSYYNFDNWAYQPSYVSSNTPWFFNGVRLQIFPTEHLKIEPWFINGWQSYGSSNHRPGLGGQIKWTPRPWMNIISNNYGLGHDDLYTPKRGRIHTDDSLEVKYYDQPLKALDKMAFTFTGDMGCEFGGGVSCYGDKAGRPKQSFLGYMLYNRFWFHKDLYAFTVGGGEINNPGRYLVLIPPINGETAASAAVNSPYFSENPGDPFKAWDGSITFDWMPKQYITFRWEFDHRHANVPYWSGPGGITPPPGTSNGYPTEYACMDGTPSPTISGCAAHGNVWYPDLRKRESLIDLDIMVKF
jgi:hypothetical protein